jgi:hypothetical protein
MRNKLPTLVLLSLLSLNGTSSFASVNKNPMTFSYDEYAPSVYSNKMAVINWNSEEGVKRFESSKYKGDFFRLAHHYKPQQQFSTCGIASAVVVMGAIYEQQGKKFPLLKSIPLAINGQAFAVEYRIINEENFYNEATDKIVDRRAIVMQYPKDVKTGQFGGGIDMDELVKMFKVHNVKSKIFYVDSVSDEKITKFRDQLKEILIDKNRFIIANSHRGYQGIEMGGHYSPIVAYDEASDSVLYLDIAAHRNPWIWIKLEDLYKSMNSKNYSGSNYRGYMVVSVK